MFKALTTPELVKRWWHAKRGEMTVAEIDLRVGGRWRYVMVADDGFEVGFHGEYLEIVPNERIVSTEVYEGLPEGVSEETGATINTATLTEDDGRTTLTILIQATSKELARRDHRLGDGGGPAGRARPARGRITLAALSARRWQRPRARGERANRRDGLPPRLVSTPLQQSPQPEKETNMDWTLELVVVPVTDVDRSKAFYTEKLGFRVDKDLMSGPMRVVQLTPPGSNCSITIGPLVVDEVPESSARYQLVIDDVEAARKQLLDRGVDVGEVTQFSDQGPQPGHGGNYNAFVFFKDPDGNNWAVQEISSRPLSGTTKA